MSTHAHQAAIDQPPSKMIRIPLSAFGTIRMYPPYMSEPDENGTTWFMNRTVKTDYYGKVISDKTTKGIGVSWDEPEPKSFWQRLIDFLP